MSSTTPIVVFFLSIRKRESCQRSAFSKIGFGNFDAGKFAGGDRVFAARMPRATLGETHQGQANASEQAMFLQGDLGVVRASRSEAAAGVRTDDGQGGGKGALVEPDQSGEGARRQGDEGLEPLNHGL